MVFEGLGVSFLVYVRGFFRGSFSGGVFLDFRLILGGFGVSFFILLASIVEVIF